MEIKKRIKLIYWVNNFYFLIGILISFKLWLNYREFPLIPIHEKLPILNNPIDLIITLTLIGLLAGSVILSNKFLNYAILFLFLILIVQDQMRWQPWAYHFLLFFIPFCFFTLKDQSKALSYFQIVLIGIYLWSGIHKLNSSFINNVFPVFAEEITGNVVKEYLRIGYLIPLTEILIALGLFFKRTRKYAIVLGIISHLSILSWLTPAGGNSNLVILPWNLAMIAFLYLCFYNTNEKSPSINFQNGRFEYLKSIIVIPVFILPMLNFWGFWDHYLSFNLYSGKNKLLYVAVEESELNKLNYDFSKAFMKISGLKGGKIIDMNKWSFQELNVPIPPDERIFRTLAKNFCELKIAKDKIMILEFEQPVSKGKYKTFECD